MIVKSAKELKLKLEQDARPKVMMVVANRIEGDARVIKSAACLEDSGLNVTIVGQKPLKSGLFEIDEQSRPTRVLVNSSEFRGADTHEELSRATAAVSARLKQLSAVINPDCLYTHDYFGLDYGSKIIGALNRNRLCYWIHDVHEYLEGYRGILSNSKIDYGVGIQSQFLSLPDRLVFVNERIQSVLNEEQSLLQPQHILHNAPRSQRSCDFDVRASCNIGPSDILGVYVGRATAARGLDIFIPALTALPQLHIAALASSQLSYLDELRARANEEGVSDRLHIFPYVDDREVAAAISSADFGISPLTRYGNADLAVPTKILEYAHANLPTVGSDASFQAEFIEKNHIGVVYTSESSQQFVEAIERLLANKSSMELGLAKIRREYNWNAMYQDIAKAAATREIASGRILQGPAPSAGQPHALAKGLRKIGLEARSIDISVKRKFGYRSDLNFPAVTAEQMFDVTMWAFWRFDVFHFHYRSFLRKYKNGWQAPTLLDLNIYRSAGKKVFFHFRGSEARINSIFSKENPFAWSEQSDPSGIPDAHKLQYIRMVGAIAHQTFVTDPELQRYVQNAEIVMRAIDCDDQELRVKAHSTHGDLPIVLHAPTRRNAKGTEYIENAVTSLLDDGLKFEFRLIEDLPHEEVAQALSQADIVVDQIIIGWYGVLSVEAMSLGKPVVANVRNELKSTLRESPVVHATPDTIKDVLRDLIEDRTKREDIGRRSASFVREHHAATKVALELKLHYGNHAYGEGFFSAELMSLLASALVPKKAVPADTIVSKSRARVFRRPFGKIPVRLLRVLFRRPVGTPLPNWIK